MVFLDPSSPDIGRSYSSAPDLFTPSVRYGIGIDADDFRLSPTASSKQFTFHVLGLNTPLLQGYWQLRRTIFCEEQHVFETSDRDENDATAVPIAALHHGEDDTTRVVGVVRIVETEPGLWYGGRLGVHSAYRRHNQIGKGLIWKAVTRANGWGCHEFLATVQIQNVRFFKRLHWTSIRELEIQGICHHLMKADLNYYAASNERRPQQLSVA